MKVSIITAVRNGALAIPATLASVAVQDHPDIEHIVVDGASTDATVEVVRQEGPHVEHLVSEPDAGVYDAFNKGLRLATGDVIAFLNAGDLYTHTRVVSSVVAAFADPTLDAVFGDVDIVASDGSERAVRHYRAHAFTASRLADGYMPPHPALFVRRRAYQATGSYDPSYRISGDFEFCVRLFVRERATFRHLPDVMTKMPRGGLSNSGLKSAWIITREMRRACRMHGVATSYPRLLARLPRKLLEFTGAADGARGES
jgi:glycosyltransferase involved in cell wall biosynthesis